ncbi:hypothetical protein [Oceanobacter mangrovi]|uniref:hypothetical protein n=1 Tax=Oceanobacter mangrovi TaxID=2862510 RepID=UPI001C8EEBC4|nr:hypothetical protein [Oceanobacter mangrovi]
MNKPSIFGLFICLSLAGCSAPSYIPMTQELRQQEKISDEEMMKLQYFVCPGVSISFHDKIDDSMVKKGVLIQRDGTYDIKLQADEWTPGVSLLATENIVAISFERGLGLPFGVENVGDQGAYKILGRQQNGSFEVFYDGKWFTMQTGLAMECGPQQFQVPQLWVDTDSLQEVIDERREFKGRMVEDYRGRDKKLELNP